MISWIKGKFDQIRRRRARKRRIKELKKQDPYIYD